MKTAVSVPDELFRQAEAAAKKLRMSRSKLYATALAEYLDRKRSKTITERLNAYYSRHPAKIDPGLMRAQIKSLAEKW
jgi:metal-responsive CopG/Arc/MetJ family transcriptional regulator